MPPELPVLRGRRAKLVRLAPPVLLVRSVRRVLKDRLVRLAFKDQPVPQV